MRCNSLMRALKSASWRRFPLIKPTQAGLGPKFTSFKDAIIGPNFRYASNAAENAYREHSRVTLGVGDEAGDAGPTNLARSCHRTNRAGISDDNRFRHDQVFFFAA